MGKDNIDKKSDEKNQAVKNKKISKLLLAILGVILLIILMIGIGFLLAVYVFEYKTNDIQVVNNEKKVQESLLEEKRILSGEIVIYKLDDGKKSGNLCKLDLDLDGEKEEISIGKLEINDDIEKFDIFINDKKVTFESWGIVHELVAFAMDEEKIILAVHSNGMSDDCTSVLYTYDGKNINNVGTFPSDISAANLDEDNSCVIISDNAIKCHSQEGTISNFVYRNFDWNGTKLIKKKEEVLEYVNQEENLRLKKELKVYKDYKDNENEAIIISPGIVHPIKKGPNNWNYIRSDDGKEGWFTFEMDEYFDIFENMNMAG